MGWAETKFLATSAVFLASNKASSKSANISFFLAYNGAENIV
jgi:hypothetical protein